MLLWDDGGMGRAGKALREVLTQYGISQNSLAVKMGLQRSAIYKWFHEERDPTAETVADIVEALKGLNGKAAEAFVHLYLGNMLKNQDPDQP
ncbi:helix-turn-helix domain-containing protein [Nodosilinea sp. PGN35]|uniref:helix-turn-helix domain-containing protein n=1 Tax=Nodosilinea sp. PGN35 TaxID=3020489 RepID=UPI003242B521